MVPAIPLDTLRHRQNKHKQDYSFHNHPPSPQALQNFVFSKTTTPQS
jgi:hypothetical protein